MKPWMIDVHQIDPERLAHQRLSHRLAARFPLFALAWIATLGILPLAAQVDSEMEAQGGFRSTHQDPASGLTLRVEGESMRYQGAKGQAVVESFKLMSFRDVEAPPMMVVTTPECVYDMTHGAAYSDRDITLFSKEHGFRVTGQRFFWSRPQSRLLIWNQVHTDLRPSREKGNTAQKDLTTRIEELTVDSDRFRYHLGKDRAVYSGQVRVASGNRLTLTASEVETRLTETADAFREIICRSEVTIDFQGQERRFALQGTNAVYRTLDPDEPQGQREEIRLTGSPSWKTDEARGAANELALQPQARSFQALGEASVILENGLALAAQTNDLPAENSIGPIEIHAEQYTFDDRTIRFSGNVRASQPPKMEMACQTMVVSLFAKKQKIRRITASGPVTIDIRTQTTPIHATGQKLVFSQEESPSPLIELTGQPSWETERYSGTAKRLTINPTAKTFTAHKNASVRINPAAPEGSGSEMPADPLPIALGNSPTTVSSEGYVIESNQARFKGGVSVDHPRWQLKADTMQLTLAENGNRIESIQARRDIHLVHKGKKQRPPQETKNAGPTAASPLHALLQGEGQSDAPSRWELRCRTLEMTRSAGGSTGSTLVARGELTLQAGTGTAFGERLTYQSSDRNIRLHGSPRVIGTDGTRLNGKEDTVFVVDPTKNRFRTQGAYHISLPAPRQETLDKSSS